MTVDTKVADRISDAIVALCNQELNAGTGPMELLAGMLLSYMALESTMPQPYIPDTLQALTLAVRVVLVELIGTEGRPV